MSKKIDKIDINVNRSGSVKLSKILRQIICLAIPLMLAACSPYKVPVEQGNYLRKDLIHQIKIGSSKQEVLDILGKPILDNGIEDDTWIYVYSRDSRKKKADVVQYRTILQFKNNKVVNMVVVEE